MKSLEFILKTHVHQHGNNSSGLACLTSIARYHDGDINVEQLAQLTGATALGTTLLGLYQAAGKIGFDIDGYSSTIEDLKSVKSPVILDATANNTLKHFIICYGYDGQFLIGDPAWGVVQYSEQELIAVWKSKTLLRLTPNNAFLKEVAKGSRKTKWIFDFIKPDIPSLSILVILDVVICFIALLPAVLLQKITDRLMLPGNFENLFPDFISLGLLTAMVLFIHYLRAIVRAIHRRQFSERMAAAFESKWINLSRSAFESLLVEKLSTVTNDIRSLEVSIDFIKNNLVKNLLIGAIALAFMFFTSLTLGLMALTGMVVYGLFGMRHVRRVVTLDQHCESLSAGTANNPASGKKIVSLMKEFNKEHLFLNITREARELFGAKVYGDRIVISGQRAQMRFLQLIIGMSVFTTTSYMVSVQKMSMGELVSVVILSCYMFLATERLLYASRKFYKTRIPFDRIFEFFTIEAVGTIENLQQEALTESKDVDLTVRDISFRFNGRRRLLNNVSFSVKCGELVVVFGDSGGGKSTIVRILERIIDVESGTILFNHRDWKEIAAISWQQKIAVVPQCVNLINRTLIENLSFEKDAEAIQEVIAFCKAHGFSDYFESLPEGYLTAVGEDGANMCPSVRQLIGLARAMFRRPRLLLLDDVTRLMDRQTEAFTLNLLESLKKETAILLFTNRLSMPGADRIYILQEGEMYLHGKHEELMKFRNCYSEGV